jgi:two-component system NtrC family sensor kinase
MSATPDPDPRAEGLADALDLGLCALDAAGVIIGVNHAWTLLLRDAVRAASAPGEVSFASWAALATPGCWSAALADVVAQVRLALSGERVAVHLEHSVPVGDSVREIDLGVRTLDPPTDSGARVLVSAQDVTERMWAHHLSPAQRKERERLELVVRYTDSAIAVLDMDGVIEWVSDTFIALTGFGREEAVGRRRWDLVRGPFLQTAAYARFDAEVRAGRPATVEAPVHRPDGSLYWAAWTVQPMYAEGRAVNLLCIERDITKRRRAEEMARQTLVRAQRLGAELRQEKYLMTSVLSTVPHGVWWKDTELTYLGCNQAYVALRGLSSAAEVVGRKEHQVLVNDLFGPRLAELEEQVLAGGDPVNDHRLTIAEPGQSLQTFLISVLPRVENRQLVGVLGVCTDVSQMAELERQVSQTSRLESIGQLAAGIAHEINTPVQYASDNVRFVADSFDAIYRAVRELQALSGERHDPVLQGRVASLIEDVDLDFLAEEVPAALAQSQEGLDRVAQIVRAMKEFSHPGGERTPTDINQLVESTVQVSRNEWKYVARLEQNLAPDVGQVPCYAGDVKQALLNILVNAAHAVEERRRRQGSDQLGLIKVSTVHVDGDVMISVADDGVGMDEEVLRRIFDPFFTTKSVGKGTGQGLSLAHSAIVTKHRGRIEVTSRPMAGSVFTIVLPVPKDDGVAGCGGPTGEQRTEAF